MTELEVDIFPSLFSARNLLSWTGICIIGPKEQVNTTHSLLKLACFYS